MRLSFPNPSRSFDATRSRVCFWGYDSSIEVTFFVEADALKQLCPDISGAEAEFLNAFDAVRKRIHEVANKVYVAGSQGTYRYTLSANDF
jgi:phage-related baseplate assembly protein